MRQSRADGDGTATGSTVMGNAGDSKRAPGDAGVRAGQRRVAAGVMLALGAAIVSVGLLARSPGHDGDAGDRTAATTMGGIDPNTATWAELAQLPGIGESIAKAIAAYREAFLRRSGSTGVVFRTPADLEPVPGVGGKMIERMVPWLRFEGAGR